MSENVKTVSLGELIEQLTHARRRMSTRKKDKDTLTMAIDVLTQMGVRIAHLEARAQAAEIIKPYSGLVVTDA